MITWGSIFLFIGITLGIFAFLMDTSVAVSNSSLFDIDRVVNLSLINQKQSMLMASGTLCIMGTVFLGAGHVVDALANLNKTDLQLATSTPSIQNSASQPNFKRMEIQEKYNKGEITFEVFQSEWEKAGG